VAAVFEHTTPLFERAKTVHDLDRAATLIGSKLLLRSNFLMMRTGSRGVLIRDWCGVADV
jgi:hypothetical protein